jgi:hypothetical protein
MIVGIAQLTKDAWWTQTIIRLTLMLTCTGKPVPGTFSHNCIVAIVLTLVMSLFLLFLLSNVAPTLFFL